MFRRQDTIIFCSNDNTSDNLQAESGNELAKRMFKTIEIGGKKILVETEPANIEIARSPSQALPRGAEPTGIGDRMKDAAQLIEDTVSSICSTVLSGMKDIAPNECSIEIGFAFKGEHSPIPVLVKVGGEASIKVVAKWTKP